MNAIEVAGVTKQYGAVHALDHVSVRFDENKIYGLLGRNGAGKSTLLNIISGRTFADAGTVALNGAPTLENDSALRNMYVLSEHTYYPARMRVADAFKWTGTFYPGFDAACASALAAAFELDVRLRVGGLSTGYNTIFKLITALSTNAAYLLLDEPVLGLDANHRDLFYKTLVAKYAEKPFCCVLSTHIVEEISSVVEDVVIIHHGRILKNEPRDELLKGGYTVTGPTARVDAFTAGRRLLGADSIGGLKTAYVLGALETLPPEGLEFSKLDLQRMFIQLTGDAAAAQYVPGTGAQGGMAQ